jgi:hypothetical protein
MTPREILTKAQTDPVVRAVGTGIVGMMRPRPVARAKSLPVALRVAVGERSLTALPGLGAALSAAARGRPGDSIVPDHFGSVLLWDAGPRSRIDAVARSLSRAHFGRTALARIRVVNPLRLGVPTLSEMLRLNPALFPATTVVTAKPLVLVTVDPADPLPLLLARTWPFARVLVVLTAPPAPGIDLTEASGVLATEGAAATLTDDAVPFRTALAGLSEVGTHVRNYVAAAEAPRHEYLFRLAGDAKAAPSRWAGADIVLRTRGQAVTPLDGRMTYAERLAGLTADAVYAGVRSGVIYAYETWVRQGQVNRVLADLLARGATLDLGQGEVR